VDVRITPRHDDQWLVEAPDIRQIVRQRRAADQGAARRCHQLPSAKPGHRDSPGLAILYRNGTIRSRAHRAALVSLP